MKFFIYFIQIRRVIIPFSTRELWFTGSSSIQLVNFLHCGWCTIWIFDFNETLQTTRRLFLITTSFFFARRLCFWFCFRLFWIIRNLFPSFFLELKQKWFADTQRPHIKFVQNVSWNSEGSNNDDNMHQINYSVLIITNRLRTGYKSVNHDNTSVTSIRL